MYSLSLGYNQLKDEPEVKDLFGSIREYYQELKSLRLDDSSFKRISSKDWKNVWNFFFLEIFARNSSVIRDFLIKPIFA